MSAPTASLAERLKAEARRLGFELAGVAPVHASDHESFFRDWLARGLHGEMGYLAREDAVRRRLDPASGWPAVRSALVVGQNYNPDDDGRPPTRADSGSEDDSTFEAHAGAGTSSDSRDAKQPSRDIIARYARGRDYHKVIKKKLLALIEWLEAELGRELPHARAYVDTGPVLERELARRAGLGWFGRNTMLIDPRRGSYYFLGVLLLDVELKHDRPFEADHCGSCNACVEACPTGALFGRDESGAPVMDATRCISYLTIEQRGPIPPELRPLIGNRVFGCDICQEVCPFNNERFVQVTKERDYRADWREAADRPSAGPGLPGTNSPSLIELMRMTHEEWDRWTRGSAIRRAGYAGFKRNVAVALGNWLVSMDEPREEALAVLREAREDGEPLVREHAAWALERSVR